MPRPYSPELVLGFVAPSGSSFKEVTASASARLAYYGYKTVPVRLSDYLSERIDLSGENKKFVDLRTPLLQQAGDDLRKNIGRSDALSYVAVREIREARIEAHSAVRQSPDGGEDPTKHLNLSSEEAEEFSNTPIAGTAYLLWSLKTEREVETLRNIYASRFLLFSVYAPREFRETSLSEKIAESRGDIGHADDYRDRSISIINTDDAESGNDFGQNVRNTYPLADLFVDATSKTSLDQTMHRAIDIAFGAPFETPTKDEWGMFFAEAAALRSAELGRQVGAAITTSAGDLLAVGLNEVPRGTGGQYWSEDYPDDHREFRLTRDTSDALKRRLAGQILDGLRSGGWLTKERADATAAELYDALERTRVRDLIEFGRAVHAELSAITDAARRGVAIQGATMYVTTFPCHHCARHIAVSGIRRVVYIYPYAKSLARDLHGDALQTEMLASADPKRVRFEPFLGVAPRQYQNLFTMYQRKTSDGTAHPVDDPERGPRLVAEEREGIWNVDAYISRELLAVRESASWFIEEKPPTAQRSELPPVTVTEEDPNV